jgi:hypothetical protein
MEIESTLFVHVDIYVNGLTSTKQYWLAQGMVALGNSFCSLLYVSGQFQTPHELRFGIQAF